MNILVVGSSVIDLFMSISEEHVHVVGSKVELTLGDKIPAEIKKFALGGNATNIAVGLTRLGVPATLYTYLGKDVLSRQIEEGVTAEGVELVAERGVQKTSPLHLIFDFKEDRIIFSNYPKADHGFDSKRVDKPDFIFLNSVSDAWENAYKNVLEFARENSIPLAFSPGTRQLDSLNETVISAIKQSKIFFSNKEEAEKIVDASKMEIQNLLEKLKEMGPEIVSVTDAGQGAYAIDAEGKSYHVRSFDPDLVSEDKTGAGDAYASAFFGAHLLGQDTKTAMMWGAVNSQLVMRQIGAEEGLGSVEEIKKTLMSKPDYQTTEI